jgi:hypothetical protein
MDQTLGKLPQLGEAPHHPDMCPDRGKERAAEGRGALLTLAGQQVALQACHFSAAIDKFLMRTPTAFRP